MCTIAEKYMLNYVKCQTSNFDNNKVTEMIEITA